MKDWAKGALLTIAVSLAIIALGAVVANMDSLFDTSEAQEELRHLMSNANAYNLSSADGGTSPNASVTLIEFSDFKCPYCRLAAAEVDKVLDYYGSSINLVFRHVPGHTGSADAAEAAECARDQGKFLEYSSILWVSSDYSSSALEDYAEDAGMNRQLFSYCLLSDAKKDVINRHAQEAASLGVPGTPAFFVNGRMLIGFQPFESLKQAIDAELSGKSSQT